MPQLLLPNVGETVTASLARRFVDELVGAELVYALMTLAGMTAVAVIFGDPVTPFYSFDFVFGIAAVFFFSITFSSALGLIMAAGLLTLMLCVNWSAGPAPLTIFLVESPFLAVFLAGLAVLPNLMPWILEKQAAALGTEVRSLEAKVNELERELAAVQKEVRVDKVDKQKRESVKYSTRAAVLNSFVRELLQSASQREILNVLFYNVTRVFGVQECAMVIAGRNQELTVARIVHPKYGDLENSKLDANLPLFRMIFDSKRELWLDSPQPLKDELMVSLLVPILVEGEIYSVFALGKTKSGDLEREEADFVSTMAALATGAIDQLKAVLAT